MALFKCKMCGGSLEINESMTVCECEYCGTKQTLPKTDNEQTLNMVNRANHFRQQCEFDKAAEVYERLIAQSDSDAELYWSLALCRYGIEYVDDPVTKKKVATCHRAQFKSILDDADYLEAIKHADAMQKSVYQNEAEYIDKIQKGILEISNKEEPFDVFICYKESDQNGRTQDSVLAQELYYQLVREGFKVFFSRITLEDKLGTEYEPYIFAALNSAKVMVVVGTKPENFDAVWVKNEWSRYLMLMQEDRTKTLIPAYKDMDPYDLPDELSMFQAQDMSKLGFMQDLIRGISKLAKADEPAEAVKETVVVNNANSSTAPLLKRVFMFLEDGDWNRADEYCEKVLDIETENYMAYLGKLMAEVKVSKQEALFKIPDVYSIRNNVNYKKAFKYGDDNFRNIIIEYNKKIDDLEAVQKPLLNNYDKLINLYEELNEIRATEVKELNEIYSCEVELSSTKNSITELTSTISENDSYIQTYQEKINKLEDERRNLCSELDSLGIFKFKRKSEINVLLSDISNQINHCEDGIKKVESVLVQSKESLSELNDIKNDQDSKLKSLKETLSETDKSKINTQISELTALIDNHINEYDELCKKYGTKKYNQYLLISDIVFFLRNVRTIDNNYDLKNAKKIYIPNSVTSIGNYAFYKCTSLTSVTIPDSVTSIGNYAFESCTSLTSVTIPDSVTSIGDEAFYGCTSLKSVTIPSSVTSIEYDTFYECTSLKSVTIPSSVTSIGDEAFYGCTSLKSVTIPSSVTSIGFEAFYGCTSLSNIAVNRGNSHYYSSWGVLFNKNQTKLIQYPQGKTSTSYLIPSSVTSIEYPAFVNCERLTSVSIPVSVTSIGEAAFEKCKSLKNVYYRGTLAQWSNISINRDGNNALKDATIHYNSYL